MTEIKMKSKARKQSKTNEKQVNIVILFQSRRG